MTARPQQPTSDRTETLADPGNELSVGSTRFSRDSVFRAAEASALVVLTCVVALLFTVLPASSAFFPTAANLRILVTDQSVLVLVSLAVLVSTVTNVWDFSPGANAGMGAIFGASVSSATNSIFYGVLACLLATTIIGVINGILVTVIKINSVIATLGMTIIISGVVQAKTGGNSIVTGIPAGLAQFGSASFLGVPKLAWAALVSLLAVHYLLRMTPLGRNLYAIGSSRTAAALVGIRTEKLTVLVFVLGGALAGVAGVLILAETGAGNPAVGSGYIIPAYAAVFLGATCISPGRRNALGMAVAIVFLGVLNSGLTLAGAPTYVNDLANGIALLAGVGAANLLAKQRGRSLTTE